MGRWTRRDPARARLDNNYYAYVDSSPIQHSDPLGLQKSNCRTSPFSRPERIIPTPPPAVTPWVPCNQRDSFEDCFGCCWEVQDVIGCFTNCHDIAPIDCESLLLAAQVYSLQAILVGNCRKMSSSAECLACCDARQLFMGLACDAIRAATQCKCREQGGSNCETEGLWEAAECVVETIQDQIDCENNCVYYM